MADDLVDDVRLRACTAVRRGGARTGSSESAGPRATRRTPRAGRGRPPGHSSSRRSARRAPRPHRGRARGRSGARPLLRLEELLHRVALVLGGKLAAHRAPHVLFGVGVGDRRGRFAGLPRERSGCDLVAPATVVRVVRARMIVGEVDRYFARVVRRHRGVKLCFLVHLSDNMYATWPGKMQVCTVERGNLPRSDGVDK